MSDLAFDNLGSLHLLWLVLAIAVVGAYGVWQRRRALRMFASAHLLGRLVPASGWARPLVRLTLVVLALAALVAAIIGPRWGQSEQKVVRRGVDVMVLLDVSRSMLARDIVPSRLERAKLSIRDDLLPALGGDRVGLITFAGLSRLKCPLTNDYGFLRLVLDEVSTRSSPRGGTLIGDAIRKAAECFTGPVETHKIVFLITDGEDQQSFPVEAATSLWKDHEIPVISIALGDEIEGARIPIKDGGGERYLEYEGEIVWSRANFADLRTIAGISNLHVFLPVGTKNFDLGEIYRLIVPAFEHLDRVESETVRQPSQAHLFAAMALALLLLESFMREGPKGARAVMLSTTNKEQAAA